MSATSQPTDFSDLFTDLMNRIRSETGSAATIIQAKRFINIGLHDMHVGFGERFPWAERSAELVTQPQYTTGTLVATKGSTAITGTSTLWDTNNDFSVKNMRAGGKIVIDGSPEVYEISSVSSDTAAVLTATFIDTTTTVSTYVYFEDAYALDADFLRPLSFTSFDINNEISLIGRNSFRNRFPRNKVTGKPKIATITDHAFNASTTPVRKVRFWKPPDAAYLIRYPFVTNKLAVNASGVAAANLSGDTDEPIVPLSYRHAIVFHALYHWFRDKRDDARSNEAKAEYTDLMIRITGDAEIGRSRPQIQPARGPYVSAARRPFRSGRSGRYTTGSAFDEIR